MRKEIVSNWRMAGEKLEDRLYSQFPLLSYGALTYLIDSERFRHLFTEHVTGAELDVLLRDIKRFFIPYVDSMPFSCADKFYRELPNTFNLITITDEEKDKE